MKVFISWSGDQSKNLAEILKQWLPAVIQAVKPYYSPDDITKGARWATEISKELEEASVGLICLTKENLAAPWVMFEAGALSKKVDKSKVCPILFGLEPSDLQGPLVQFQATKFEKEDIKKIVWMMNAELGDKGIQQNVFDDVFEMWWPKLAEKVKQELSSGIPSNKKDVRPERELLEEILVLTRATSLSAGPSQREPHIFPGAIDDLMTGFRQLLRVIYSEPTNENLAKAITKLRKPISYLGNRPGFRSKIYPEIAELMISISENSRSGNGPDADPGED